MTHAALFWTHVVSAIALCFIDQQVLLATDYFLTIGGGYQPSANQASLEANVLFFQKVLLEKHSGSRTQATFFADGIDSESDLQVLTTPIATAAEKDTPATDLLQRLYSFRSNQSVEYRNHRISPVSGPNSPPSISSSLKHMCSSMKAGDRLIVYVTAHGGSAKGKNKFNTTISCWDDQSISAREFTAWLDAVPTTVPVVMVMAQCYCGGFAHTVFNNANRNDGLSDRLRVGFFAQQHDLPAAGCRPDIENDEEYSSFFWGAFVGRSRNGKAMQSADYDDNKKISFAEAHAHALLTSETIDIPLRSTEVLLRSYSRIEGYDHLRTDDSDIRDSQGAEPSRSVHQLVGMVGSFQDICRGTAPEMQRTVQGLCEQLDLKMGDAVENLFENFETEQAEFRSQRRNSFRGRRRGSSGRRELREEIVQQWPELGEPNWKSAAILQEPGQSKLWAEIQNLPNYARFIENQRNREMTADQMEQAELREVKYERLIHTLEAILLAKNLGKVATPAIVQKYQQMLAVEQSTLNPALN